MKPVGVLFVCTGNICRSPTAEGIFLHKIREAGLSDKVFADSAGTHGYHAGEPPDHRAVRIAKGRGVDISALRARKIAPEDFGKFALIVALDRGHLSILETLHPGEGASLSLLMPYDKSGLQDVPDPYYEKDEAFERVFGLIARGVDGLIAMMKDTYRL